MIQTKTNKGKPAKAKVMILLISIYLSILLAICPSPAMEPEIIVDTCKLRDNNIKSKVSISAQIIYHCSISPESIPGIVIYILSTWKSYRIELA
jgi:hypothetical protein